MILSFPFYQQNSFASLFSFFQPRSLFLVFVFGFYSLYLKIKISRIEFVLSNNYVFLDNLPYSPLFFFDSLSFKSCCSFFPSFHFISFSRSLFGFVLSNNNFHLKKLCFSWQSFLFSFILLRFSFLPSNHAVSLFHPFILLAIFLVPYFVFVFDFH